MREPMPRKPLNPIQAIRIPEAFRGLDAMVDRVCEIVQRRTAKTPRQPVAKSA